MKNINNIACEFKTCKNYILLQLDINKGRVSKLDKLDSLYINYVSTALLQISNNDLI